MKAHPIVVALFALSVASLSGCPAETCESSVGCRDVDVNTECVAQADDTALCEPTNVDREATSCEAPADCDGFPVEVDCTNGICECPAVSCDGAFSTRLCLCFASDGAVGATCFESTDCNDGFSCVDKACTDEPQVGGPCSDNEQCAGGVELFTCINDTCRQLPDDNGVCDDNDDCRIRPTDRCVNGQCHTNAGQPGNRCFDNSDCFTESCDIDFFCE